MPTLPGPCRRRPRPKAAEGSLDPIVIGSADSQSGHRGLSAVTRQSERSQEYVPYSQLRRGRSDLPPTSGVHRLRSNRESTDVATTVDEPIQLVFFADICGPEWRSHADYKPSRMEPDLL